MTAAEFEKWTAEHGTGRRSHSANRINYEFVTLRDGWIAVFERFGSNYEPLIQAADEPHAISYCSFREPLTVPAQEI